MDILKGKKALVTGSSRGIGLKVTETFLSEGAEVWGMCTHESKGKAATEALAAEHGTAYHEFYADASDAEALKAGVEAVLKEAGSFDILVNNAGITRDTLSFRMEKKDWDSVIAVNLTAAFIVCQIVSFDMVHKRTGSIINMSSIAGVHGNPGQVNYSASKGGLIAMSKSLAKECGGRGVRVNCIAPGFIETDMTQAVKEDVRKGWIEGIPLKRAGKPEDVANAALFLASDLSSYITGQVIGVDGGMGA
ncbi:MAG: 3-oxoacyl-[acyl-carrier-protein] reductase [Treponema sp.]|nr:3-oxoacyl-[acyl-carrier-protein] reductase [Treponema sp.]